MNKKLDALAKRMLDFITRTMLCGAVAAQFAWQCRAADLYVDANAAAGGNGSAAFPLLRITDAVEQARQLRQRSAIRIRERIVIHVAVGNYVGTFNANPLENNGNKEALPIIINVPNVTLAGATGLDHDAHGLPTGPSSRPDTKLKVGNEIHDPSRTLILVTRTTDGWAGDGFTITGFTLDENASAKSPGATAIFIDRVTDFIVAHNAFVHTAVSCLTRMSSGTVEDNFFLSLGWLGPAIHGGSINHPARVTVRNNRATGGFAGMDFRGSPTMRTLELGTSGLTIEPLQITYDRNNPRDLANIPDTLDIVIDGNDFSGNDAYGLWCFGFAPFFGYTTSDASQPITSVVRASITGNTCSDNGDYGLIVEPVGSFRNNPRRFISSFTCTLQGNSFEGNGRSPALFTFVSADVDLFGASLQDFKYVEQSTYRVNDPEAELAGFDYNNPVNEPLSGVPLNNAIVINGVRIPAGVKISSLKK